MEQTAVEWLEKEYIKLYGGIIKVSMLSSIEQAKQMESTQRGYSKEDVLKAGEIGEINHYDYEHIVSLLDEARELNNSKSK